VTSLNLCDGEVLFDESEVPDMDIQHEQVEQKQVSAGGRVTALLIGASRQILTLTFRIEYRDTLEKLAAIRASRTSFMVFPFWRYDQVTGFEAIWTGVGQFHERWVHGSLAAQWEIPVTWEEVLPGVCVTPSS
jgi:hypothetical protein